MDLPSNMYIKDGAFDKQRQVGKTADIFRVEYVFDDLKPHGGPVHHSKDLHLGGLMDFLNAPKMGQYTILSIYRVHQEEKYTKTSLKEISDLFNSKLNERAGKEKRAKLKRLEKQMESLKQEIKMLDS